MLNYPFKANTIHTYITSIVPPLSYFGTIHCCEICLQTPKNHTINFLNSAELIWFWSLFNVCVCVRLFNLQGRHFSIFTRYLTIICNILWQTTQVHTHLLPQTTSSFSVEKTSREELNQKWRMNWVRVLVVTVWVFIGKSTLFSKGTVVPFGATTLI